MLTTFTQIVAGSVTRERNDVTTRPRGTSRYFYRPNWGQAGGARGAPDGNVPSGVKRVDSTGAATIINSMTSTSSDGGRGGMATWPARRSQ